MVHDRYTLMGMMASTKCGTSVPLKEIFSWLSRRISLVLSIVSNDQFSLWTIWYYFGVALYSVWVCDDFYIKMRENKAKSQFCSERIERKMYANKITPHSYSILRFFIFSFHPKICELQSKYFERWKKIETTFSMIFIGIRYLFRKVLDEWEGNM